MSDVGLDSLHFDSPPVVEVIFGVGFPPLKGWKIPYYGIFWNLIRAEYPNCDALQPVATQPSISFVNAPSVRCLYSSDAEQKVIQLQDDHFFYNWRKAGPNDHYPEYKVIRPVFEREWSRVNDFFDSENVPRPAIDSCDLTYVNHLRKGSEWNSLSDLPEVFTIIKQNEVTESRSLEGFNYTITLPLEDSMGNLTLQVQPALIMTSAEQIVQFTLAARGRPKMLNDQGILTWFDAAHNAIRTNFFKATTELMHKHWQIRKA